MPASGYRHTTVGLLQGLSIADALFVVQKLMRFAKKICKGLL
jgi:hypothetical protein